MTISVSLHRVARSGLCSSVSNDGYSQLTLFSKEFQGHEDRVGVWFPRKLAEKLHAEIEAYRQKVLADDLAAPAGADISEGAA